MRTQEIHCCKCDIELAWWGGGVNRQYADEWLCNNQRLRRRVPEGVTYKKHSSTFTMGGTERSEDNGGLKYQYLHCAVSNNSVYCETCARKLKYKCKNCRTGRIRLDRKA